VIACGEVFLLEFGFGSCVCDVPGTSQSEEVVHLCVRPDLYLTPCTPLRKAIVGDCA
jgi:hypothetical protein